jgi:hypothetical protein
LHCCMRGTPPNYYLLLISKQRGILAFCKVYPEATALT